MMWVFAITMNVMTAADPLPREVIERYEFDQAECQRMLGFFRPKIGTGYHIQATTGLMVEVVSATCERATS